MSTDGVFKCVHKSDPLERSISPTATGTALEAVTEVIAKIQELFRIRKFSFVLHMSPQIF